MEEDHKAWIKSRLYGLKKIAWIKSSLYGLQEITASFKVISTVLTLPLSSYTTNKLEKILD
jgi:hypothetical protein